MANNSNKAWPLIVTLSAVYMGHCLMGTCSFSIGIFYMELLNRYKEGEEKTSLVGSLNVSVANFLAPLIGMFANRYSSRVSVCLGGFLIALGCLLSATSDSVVGFIIYFGVISGIGNAFTGMPLSIVLGYYVEKHRHLFIALVPSFIAIGMFISTPLSLFLIDSYGIHGAYMLLGGISLHICVIGVLCKPSFVEKQFMNYRKKRGNETVLHINNGAEVTINQDGKTIDNTKESDDESKITLLNTDIERRTIWSPAFIFFLFGTCAWNSVMVTMQMNLPNVMNETGHSNDYITVIMTCFSLSNFAGRLLFGLMSIREDMDGVMVYIASMFIAGLASIGYPLYYGFEFANHALAIMSGFLTGAPNAVMASMALKIVGLDNLSTAYSIESFFVGIGVFSGPVIASILSTNFKSIFTIFIFTGCVSFAGSLSSICAWILLKGTYSTICTSKCFKKPKMSE